MNKKSLVEKTEKTYFSAEKTSLAGQSAEQADQSAEKCIPKYAAGEILVRFKPNIDAGRIFASGFGKAYCIAPKKTDDYFITDAYVYLTAIGKEDSICRKLSRKKDFIDWAKRRDLNLEQKTAGLGELPTKRTALHELFHAQPKSNYDHELETLLNYVNSIRKK